MSFALGPKLFGSNYQAWQRRFLQRGEEGTSMAQGCPLRFQEQELEQYRFTATHLGHRRTLKCCETSSTRLQQQVLC